MIILTDEQSGFVNHKNAAFVTACPGGGKTQAIVARLKRIVPSVPPRKGVAVLSFTNSAIEEIRAKCRGEELHSVLRHPHVIGTFDAFLRQFFIAPFGLAGVIAKPTVLDSWDAIPVKIRLGGRMAFPGDGVSLD